jgi:photosystem II stability/assembly factor-like uncharacterized protein
MLRFGIVSMVGLCGSATFAQWDRQPVRTDADFRGLAAVGDKVAWASGTKGTFVRTADGGKTWTLGTVPGAEKLDFRDVEAFGDSIAYLLSAGPGEASRIYKTTDAGKTWTLQFQNAEKDGFFDSLAFWDEKNGIALSDPVKRQFLLVTTADGKTWKPLDAKLPTALPNEGAFAASGTCLVTHGENDVWFATGGAQAARVFHSADRGKTWEVSETPILAGVESAGIFSIAFRDPKKGVIVGSDYKKPDAAGVSAAVTADGGKTWTPAETALPFLSGVARAKDQWVAVGPTGSFASPDGKTWTRLDRENFNAVQFTATSTGWAVGPKGSIAKFTK